MESILELLEEVDGEVTDSLKNRLEEITDLEKLKCLHKLAARVDSVAEFETKMSEGVLSKTHKREKVVHL